MNESTATGKTCPYCAMTIPLAALICPHCQKRLPRKMSKFIAGLIVILVLLAIINVMNKPEPSPAASRIWSETTNIDINKTLVANGITGCSMLKWQQQSNYEFRVKCSEDNTSWKEYEVWTVLNKVYPR